MCLLIPAVKRHQPTLVFFTPRLRLKTVTVLIDMAHFYDTFFFCDFPSSSLAGPQGSHLNQLFASLSLQCSRRILAVFSTAFHERTLALCEAELREGRALTPSACTNCPRARLQRPSSIPRRHRYFTALPNTSRSATIHEVCHRVISRDITKYRGPGYLRCWCDPEKVIDDGTITRLVKRNIAGTAAS